MGRGLFSGQEFRKKKWEKIKNDPELHNKILNDAKKSNKKYRELHREEHNLKQKELREIAIELGNCSSCYQEKDNPKYKTCSKCRKYQRDYKLKIKG
jgi:signal recognition particle subunit SEC65